MYGQLGGEIEVVVVDNASEDGAPDMVAAEFPQATLVRRTSNDGFARGVNHGFSRAQGQHVLLLNPDSVLDENILPPMLDYQRGHPDVAILAPKLIDDDGTLQLSCRAFPRIDTALFNRYSWATRVFRNNRFSRRYLMTDFDHSRVADVDWASAACWLMPRRAYDAIGPLDEAYFWSLEDVDYCQRAHRAGWRVVYFPDVGVRHLIGGSARTRPARAVRARHRGIWRYYRSYLRPGGPLAPAIDAAVWLGIQARCWTHLATSQAGGLLARSRR
jgi:hypothetical protein